MARLPRGRGRQNAAPRAAPPRTTEGVVHHARHGEFHPSGSICRPVTLVSAEPAESDYVHCTQSLGPAVSGPSAEDPPPAGVLRSWGPRAFQNAGPPRNAPSARSSRAPKPTESRSIVENQRNSSYDHIRGAGGRHPHDRLVSAEKHDSFTPTCDLKKIALATQSKGESP